LLDSGAIKTACFPLKASANMETELRQRVKSPPISGIALGEEEPKGHPGGDIKHGAAAQILRLLLFIIYFNACCCSYVTQEPFPELR
jgi:hypothetical protein